MSKYFIGRLFMLLFLSSCVTNKSLIPKLPISKGFCSGTGIDIRGLKLIIDSNNIPFPKISINKIIELPLPTPISPAREIVYSHNNTIVLVEITPTGTKDLFALALISFTKENTVYSTLSLNLGLCQDAEIRVGEEVLKARLELSGLNIAQDI